MSQSVIAIFETNEEAQKAKHALISKGFDISQIDVNYNVDVEEGRSTDGQQTTTNEHFANEGNQGSIVTVHVVDNRELLDATAILEDLGAIDVNEFSAKPAGDSEPLFDPENIS
ncbi:hypothetical protein [Dyadobacter psychrophilus]|uniref:General stress protein 17M-like domain-containing protein n=1 Tax=Dyadobacter psychrophilus TaxID=651661 RepID=A0A1T5F9D2_9BACT|nr:hypothetical protein [Dyadobacter psychrophilus]SKB92795.1 hypothetical protein SAMN05660293_02914 [Dyadobacter psychrophilus]